MMDLTGLPYADQEVPDLDTLNKMFARTKGQLFIHGKGSGFLGSLLCDHTYVWDDDHPTAWCNGSTIGWNPKFFVWLTPAERVTVLAHELWHTGYAHMERIGSDRCLDYWNQAADYVINGILDRDKYLFGEKLKSLKPCLDHQYDDMTTEQVYALLDPPPVGQSMPRPGSDPGNQNGSQDLGDGSDGKALSGDLKAPANADDLAKIKSKLVKAIQASRMSKEAGVIPGETTLLIEEFLNPILPWEVLLARFFNDISKDDYSWKRPSRRYEDEYLPSPDGDNRLEHLSYYLDISGSVSDPNILRFNSEVKHIHEAYNPKRLTLVTFDTEIQDIYEFVEDMPFDKIEVHGRGGTDLDPVRRHILKTQPTAAIIFSDLFVHPMTPDPRIPVLWVVVGNDQAKVLFGQKVHIDSEYTGVRVPGPG